MFVTFKAVLEAFVFMFTNLDLVQITVQKIMDYVKIKMFHGHTRKPSSASGTCCAMDSTTNQKLPYPIECPSLDDLADLAKGEKGMYKALYAQTKAQFTQEMLANPQKLQFLLSPEFIKQHMGRVSAFDPVLWQQSKLHYVSYAVWYNHRANPEYIARKDIDGLSVGTMLKQNTTTVLLSNEVPHPLLEELSNADDDTLSKFNEIRTMASLRLHLHCQFQQLWTLVPLILLLCVVRLTPTETMNLSNIFQLPLLLKIRAHPIPSHTRTTFGSFDPHRVRAFSYSFDVLPGQTQAFRDIFGEHVLRCNSCFILYREIH
jgi:hypothetical protein